MNKLDKIRLYFLIQAPLKIPKFVPLNVFP